VNIDYKDFLLDHEGAPQTVPNTAGCAINRRFTYVKWSTLIQGEVKEHYASFDIEYPIIKLDNEPKAYLNCIASGCRASDSRIFLRQKL